VPCVVPGVGGSCTGTSFKRPAELREPGKLAGAQASLGMDDAHGEVLTSTTAGIFCSDSGRVKAEVHRVPGVQGMQGWVAQHRKRKGLGRGAQASSRPTNSLCIRLAAVTRWLSAREAATDGRRADS
jgi:hypothetical protein